MKGTLNMNKIYTIEITETLQKQVKIKASSQEEAEKKVREQYQNNEIVLDSNDYIDTCYQCIKEEKIMKEMER